MSQFLPPTLPRLRRGRLCSTCQGWRIPIEAIGTMAQQSRPRAASRSCLLGAFWRHAHKKKNCAIKNYEALIILKYHETWFRQFPLIGITFSYPSYSAARGADNRYYWILLQHFRCLLKIYLDQPLTIILPLIKFIKIWNKDIFGIRPLYTLNMHTVERCLSCILDRLVPLKTINTPGKSLPLL